MGGRDGAERLIRLKDYVDAVMVSDGDFATRLTSALDDLCAAGISAWVTVKWSNEVVGRYHPSTQPNEPANGPNVHKRDFPLDVGSVHIALKIETGAGRTSNDIFDELKQICGAHWGNRDTSVLIENVKIARVQERLNAALRRAAGTEITALRLDLDKFKDVNTEHGSDVGDKVLMEFAARVRKHLAKTSIVVREGGDEFFAFFIDTSFDGALLSINNFHMEMGQTPFRDISEIKTASIGVTRITPNAANYKAALEPATHIEERLKKSGVRNFIAVAAERRKQVAPNPLSINDLSKLAVHCRFLGHVRQNAMVPILSQVIYSLLDGADAVAIPQKLQDLKSRFQISIQHNLIASEPAITCELTPQEWATAVIFSLLKRFADGKGPIEALDELTLAARSKKLFLDVVRVHDEATHSIELCALLDEQPDITAKIGRGWVPMSVNVPGAVSIWAPNSSTEDTSASPVVLMPIGDDALQAARQFEGAVAGIVAVDDRPVTGGGLPDFWQSNIARVIHAALRNPNVRHILVIGDAERAHRTVDYLRKSQDDWRLSAATLPEKLAISHARITEFIDRNLDIKISTTDDIAHTLCNMYSSLTESVSIKGQPTDLERASQARRILTASQLPNDERLFHRDGLRAKTLADAYPRVIHILRSETQEPNQPELAGRQFRELTGFKLVLENPFVDEVPHYWSSEQTDFHTYYDIQFCKPNEGTFGPRLLKERPIQAGTNLSVRASALDQVERAIRDHRATRRVMLSVAEAEDLGKPLGLAHIQILPRYIAQQWRLDFLWVWRTVEALVGLPFSAYGSVRWSMAFLEDLKARLGGTLPLESGNLTYVAMSLHMYLDDGDKEIARTIVQHASI